MCHFKTIPFKGIIFPFSRTFFSDFFFIYLFKTEEQFSILVNFDNDLRESGDPQLHQSETDENELDEKCIVKNIPSC